MRLLDNIAMHPKLLKAGELIGTSGRARALGMYVAAIGYCRQYLTDGRIPKQWVNDQELDSEGEKVAHALSDRRVRLWKRDRGGYIIHDFFDFNDHAVEVRRKRLKEKQRLATLRRGHKGNGR